MLNYFFGWSGLILGILGIVISIWQTNYVIAGILIIFLLSIAAIAYWLWVIGNGPPYRSLETTVKVDFTKGRKLVPCDISYRMQSLSTHNKSIAFEGLRSSGAMGEISYDRDLIKESSVATTSRGMGLTLQFRAPKRIFDIFNLKLGVTYTDCFNKEDEYIAHDLTYDTKKMYIVAIFPKCDNVKYLSFTQVIGGERVIINKMRIEGDGQVVRCEYNRARAGQRFELTWSWDMPTEPDSLPMMIEKK